MVDHAAAASSPRRRTRRTQGRRGSVARALAFAAALAATMVVPAGMAMASASGGASVQVLPSTAYAGATVDVAGTGLGAEAVGDLVLAGNRMVLDLGAVQADSEGSFRAEVEVPSHVPAGSYELRLNGDEAIAATLEIAAPSLGTWAPPAGPAVQAATRAAPDGADAGMATLLAVAVLASMYLASKTARLRRALRESRR